MKKILAISGFSRFLILLMLTSSIGMGSGCRATYYKVPVTKSRKHFRPYNDKKDRGRPRTKVKKYKSLKSTRKINVQ